MPALLTKYSGDLQAHAGEVPLASVAMMDLLIRLEATGLGTWVREAPTLWAYPTVLFLHTAGLGFLVGINVAIDLRLLGVAPGVPLAALRRLFPVMWAGFWINAMSGAVLIVADATTKLTNPVFYVKMLFVAAGVVVMASFKRRLLDGDATANEGRGMSLTQARGVAIASLVIWAGATTAGRLMGYLGPKSGLE
jgi:hypothetical protein